MVRPASDRRRSPRFRRTGRRSTGEVVQRRIEMIEQRRGHRADRAARVQAALAVRAVGEQGAAALTALAAGPVRGPRSVVRRHDIGRRAAAADDGEPAGRPVARRRGIRVGGAAVCGRRTPTSPTCWLTSPTTEHVPYLAALRYKDTGLRKRAAVGTDLGSAARRGRDRRSGWTSRYRRSTPRPTSARLVLAHRGKLDVPKERFISYPQASPDGDGSLLLGWAGWDHREQAHALMTIIEDRATRDGWEGSG